MKANFRSKGIWAALAVMLLASVAWVRPQAAGAGAAAVPSKVGVISIRNAIVSTAEGKQAQAQLQSQFAPKQNELQDVQKQIEDIQRRMNEGARTLSDDEKAKLQRQGEMLSRRLQRGNQDLNDEVNAAQADVVDTIGRKMLDVVDRYARENGYVVVLDSSSQNTPVVYSSAQSDITQDIVRLYDQAYPVKNAPASSAPASRPAAPPPAKKQP
jgi:outer membrane protein